MSRSVRALIALAALVIAAGVGLVLVMADGDESPPTYTAATRDAFLEACTARGGDDVAEGCSCLYDAIVAEIPYEQYRAVSDELLEAPPASGPLPLPEEFDPLLRACRRAAPLPQ
jgi:hypothetical protein